MGRGGWLASVLLVVFPGAFSVGGLSRSPDRTQQSDVERLLVQFTKHCISVISTLRDEQRTAGVQVAQVVWSVCARQGRSSSRHQVAETGPPLGTECR